MTSAAKHTAGPWDYFVGNANGRGLTRVEAALTSDDAGEHICSFPRGAKGEAHAALMAEAGTILHETGLTPRQLAEQRGELVKALSGMTSLYVELAESGDAGFWDAEKVDEVIASRAAITKAEGATLARSSSQVENG